MPEVAKSERLDFFTSVLQALLLPEGERKEVVKVLVAGELEPLFQKGYRVSEGLRAIEGKLRHAPLDGVNLRGIVTEAWSEYLQRNHSDKLQGLTLGHHAGALLRSVKEHDESRDFRFGVRPLDGAIGGGLRPGELGVLVGSPGSMKTSLALHGVERYLDGGGKVLFFSLDMPPQEIIRRRLQARLKCPSWKVDELIRQGDPRIPEMLRAMEREDGGRFLLIGNDEGERVTLERVVDLTETIVPNLVVIDYLTLLRGPKQSDLEAVNESMPRLKDLGQRSGVTFLLLSQMGRGSRTEQAAGKIGGHSKGGGIVEELCHVEVELLRDVPETEGESPRIVATVAKTRRGVAGASFELEYDGPSMTFTGWGWKVARERPQRPVFTAPGGPA